MEEIHYSKSCYTSRYFNNENSFTMQITSNSEVVPWYNLKKTQGTFVLKLVDKFSVIQILSQDLIFDNSTTLGQQFHRFTHIFIDGKSKGFKKLYSNFFVFCIMLSIIPTLLEKCFKFFSKEH